jgi:hypothetical protein
MSTATDITDKVHHRAQNETPTHQVPEHGSADELLEREGHHLHDRLFCLESLFCVSPRYHHGCFFLAFSEAYFNEISQALQNFRRAVEQRDMEIHRLTSQYEKMLQQKDVCDYLSRASDYFALTERIASNEPNSGATDR